MKVEKLLRKLFQIAVDKADPIKTIPNYLSKHTPKQFNGRVIVIGAGKASARMAEAVEQVWGACEGLVITRYGYARPTKKIEIIEAGHPVSDENGLLATQKLLSIVSGLNEKDFILNLVSGGGSALLCAPIDGLNLVDKQLLHEKLLASGAPINEMNTVRKHFSKVKGGQLAALAYPATMLNLMISDVPGDNPKNIASGATVAEDSSVEDVINILDKYQIELPNHMLKALKAHSSVISSKNIKLSKSDNRVISAPSQSLQAVNDYLLGLDCQCQILGDAIEGEARDVGKQQAILAMEIQKKMKKGDAPIILLSGGECTVSGNNGGIGGPNAEFALSAAITLSCQKNIYLIACDTDGVDGGDEVAGSYVHPNTLKVAKKLEISAKKHLQKNDSHSFFKAIDDQIITGPTLTNVNDFRAILIRYNEE